jgi:hypothetical protein
LSLFPLRKAKTPPKCEKKTLDKYIDTECVFGNRDFRFGKIGEAFLQFAKVTTVTPVENGLNFMFPPERESEDDSLIEKTIGSFDNMQVSQ